ncbi:MAG: branched-chain-amino-acid transaminase [Phycisphaerae bacterium]
MSQKIWLDGELVNEENAKISVFDHGLLYGDGVFEGIRVYSGKIFREEDHLIRFFDCAKFIRLDIGYTTEEVGKAMRDTVAANGITNGYIRLVATRGAGTLGLNPFLCPKSSMFVIAAGVKLYSDELYQDGLRVVSSSIMRNPTNCVPPQVKSLNYLNNILAKIEALDNGVLEAIMYNSQGYVTEATGDNVFIVKNGVLYSPPVSAGSLSGITRKVVIELAEKAQIKFIERNLTRYNLYTADEIFLTGTAAEVIGVVCMDGRTIGTGKPGPMTVKLKDMFHNYAHSC